MEQSVADIASFVVSEASSTSARKVSVMLEARRYRKPAWDRPLRSFLLLFVRCLESVLKLIRFLDKCRHFIEERPRIPDLPVKMFEADI